MYSSYQLTLMVQHACNLRCAYCYTGRKFSRAMTEEIGIASIKRAVNSIEPGGKLELGFFGGEPLLEAELILQLVNEARRLTSERGQSLQLSMTTNGTITNPAARQVMLLDEMNLHVSHDGLPEVHDRHRVGLEGESTSAEVLRTIQGLQEQGKQVSISMVVRPDTVEFLPEGLRWFKEQGISHVDPTLDLWATWSKEDAQKLDVAIVKSAEVWLGLLPDFGVGWFNQKLAEFAAVPQQQTARCGFGEGQIAVSPAGNLYPCERLIGEDQDGNAMRLPGHVLEGDDYCGTTTPNREPPESCQTCVILDQCNTFCRCSNFIRTKNTDTPDGLLCLLDQACFREVRRVTVESQSAVFQNTIQPEDLVPVDKI